MTFGDHSTDFCPGECDEAESFALLDRFERAGGNFIDTANMYTKGNAESILGAWLSKRDRSKFILATKCRFPADPSGGQNDSGLSRHAILMNLNDSLKRLRTSYIDVTSLFDFYARDCIQEGKIHYIGVSNFASWHIEKMVHLCEKHHVPIILANQSQYSLLARELEWDVIPCCLENKVCIIPWSPLKGGLLTGKYTPDMKTAPVGTRINWADKTGNISEARPSWSDYQCNAFYWQVIDELRKVAKELNKSMSQVALRWLLQQRGVPSVVIGVRNLKQLEDNIGAVGWRLSDAQMRRLTDVSAIPLPYPHNLIENVNQ